MRYRFRISYHAQINMWGILFVLPSLAFFVAFKFWPMGEAFALSFYNADLLTPSRFVGLGNYAALLNDHLFSQSVDASVYYVVGTVVPIWILSLLFALAFNQALRAKNIWRLLYFIPVIMSQIAVALVWKFMYHPDGLVNTFLHSVGLEKLNWLTSEKTAMLALLLPGIWRGTPYFMIIFLAGLQAIPTQYYEAARIDGATGFKAFWRITFPLLKNTTVLVIVMSIIIGIKVFLNPMVMTGGGPAGATRVLPLLIYQTGFEFFKMGRASAMSMLMFLAMMTFTLVQLRLFRHQE